MQTASTNLNVRGGMFYRKLVPRLSLLGIKRWGMGGFRGRWRSFQTGHSGAMWCTEYYKSAKVILRFMKPDGQERYWALRRIVDVDGNVGGTLQLKICEPPDQEKDSADCIEHEWDEAISLEKASEVEMEAVRVRMADKLVAFQEALQPHLNRVMRD